MKVQPRLFCLVNETILEKPVLSIAPTALPSVDADIPSSQLLNLGLIRNISYIIRKNDNSM